MNGRRVKGQFSSVPIAVRFWRKVQRGAGCWLWAGSKYSNGYGRVWDGRKLTRAHRVAMRLVLGRELGADEYVLHSCDNPLCVKPAHLRIGTQAENMADMSARKRTRGAQITHCPSGHEYNEANTKWYRGRRYCRLCPRHRSPERVGLRRAVRDSAA